MLAKAFPLLSCVLLLFAMGFFMLASPMLLILKHQVPEDGRVVRGLFGVYYRGVTVLAALGAIGCGATAHVMLALVLGGLCAYMAGLGHWVLRHMDRLRERIIEGNTAAIAQFRRLHVAAMALNGVQVGVLIWGVGRL